MRRVGEHLFTKDGMQEFFDNYFEEEGASQETTHPENGAKPKRKQSAEGRHQIWHAYRRDKRLKTT